MYRAIHGHKKPHSHTAISLWNIGHVQHMQKNLIEAAKFLEQSLDMLRILHGRNSLHPDITGVLSNLNEVYEDQERCDEAAAVRERNTEADETSDGEVSNRTLENY